LGFGDWELVIGDWVLGPIPNPQSPIPNPQSPLYQFNEFIKFYNYNFNNNIIKNKKIIVSLVKIKK